jgi:L-2-hydroxyglutarate oxidase LhgO
VIHAGIYYPPGSLKAALCVEGRDLLYAYCVRHDIAHRKLGKLIVAQEEEAGYLDTLFRNAENNGVSALQWLGSGDIRAREPLVKGHAALYSPESGVLDGSWLDAESSLQCASRRRSVCTANSCLAHRDHAEALCCRG